MKDPTLEVIAAGIIAIILATGMLGIIGMTGFAVIDTGSVRTDKNDYIIGDMVQLLLPEDTADYTIEVIDPEGKLMANGITFFVDKSGKYTINAELVRNGERENLKAYFNVEDSSGKNGGDEEMLKEETNAIEPAENTDSEIPEEPTQESQDESGNYPEQEDTNASGSEEANDVQNSSAALRTPTNASDNSAAEGVFSGEKEARKEERVLNARVEFTKDKMRPRESIDRRGNREDIIEMEEQGVKITIEGANPSLLNMITYENGTITAPSVDITEATISIPHTGIPAIGTLPQLYIKEDDETEFRPAVEYKNNNETFNKIEITPTHYVFSVEHFTQYFINSSGGDYTSLEACLLAQNNTANTCQVNQAINENFTTASSYYFLSHIVQLTEDGVNNTYIDFNNSAFYGDDGVNDVGIDFVGGASDDSVHNSTIKNIGFVNVAFPLMMSSISGVGQSFSLSNFNASSMTGSSTIFYLNSHNSTVKDINIFDGTILGVSITNAGDSNFSKIMINNISTYGISLSSGVSNDVFSFINISNINLVDGTSYGLHFANDGGNDNVTNCSFSYINGTGLYFLNVNSTVKNNIFENNTLEGLRLIHNVGGRVDIYNNTFRYNDHEASKFLASYSRTNVSGTLMNGGNPVVLNSALGGAITISANDTDVSALFDGVSNFSRWSVNAPTAGLPIRTIYVQMGYGTSCATAGAAYGGSCYGYQDDYWVANGGSNYTINPAYVTNQTISVMQGDVNPPYVRNAKQKNNGDILVQTTGFSLNISGNTFIDKTYELGDSVRFISDLAGTNAVLWLNNYYYNANMTGQDSSLNYCREGIGNFLASAVTFSKGVGECGPINITAPSNGQTFLRNSTVQINWTPQSSQNSISYYLSYSHDSGTSWTNIATVSAANYSWNIASLPAENDYLIRIIPFDSTANATENRSRSVFTINPINQLVCSNSALCEYQNITSALDGENSTGKNITLTDNDRTYTILKAESYNISNPRGIILNASNITLNCNSSIIIGAGFADSKGISAENVNNASIQYCNVQKYNYGIFLNNSNESRMITNNVSNDTIGMYAISSYQLNFTNNTVTQASQYGIFLESAHNSFVKNNTMNNMTGSANSAFIIINGTTNTTISGNSIKNAQASGLLLNNSNQDIVANNTLNNTRGIRITASDRNNITGNAIESTYSGYDDLSVDSSSSGNNTVWLNRFYSLGVNNSGTNTAFCIAQGGENRGNFYAAALNASYMLNALNDCGAANITFPTINTNHTTQIRIAWKNQSSQTAMSYFLRYSTDGDFWTDIGSTTNQHYTWTVNALPESNNYRLLLGAYDSSYNATNDTSDLFGIDNTAPSLTLLNQTMSDNAKITPSNPARAGSNITIRANITDVISGISDVRLTVWQTTRSAGSIIINGQTRLLDGNSNNGTWEMNFTANDNLADMGEINYTVYVNDTANNQLTFDANFSIVDNEQVCSNASACEYASITSALDGENNTAITITLIDANKKYTFAREDKYRISPSGMIPAISMNASNQTIDCANSEISGTNTGTGIFSRQRNTSSVQNCVFRDFSVSLNFTNSSSNTVKDSRFLSSTNEIYLFLINDSLFSNINLSDSAGDSLLVYNSSNITFKDMKITNSSMRGINLISSYWLRFYDINSSANVREGLLVNLSSDRMIIENSSFTGSSSRDNVRIDGLNTNISGSSFSNISSGRQDLFISSIAESTNVWANNFLSGGVNNSGTASSFCVNNTGNYYNQDINLSYRVIGSCGNLSEPYDDKDGDRYFTIYDCNDNNFEIYPGATERCDEFDDDCDGIIDEGGVCAAKSFSTGGSSGGGGAGFTQSSAFTQDLAQNPEVILSLNARMEFSINNEQHYMTLEKVYFNKVRITVRSEPQTFELRINESKEIDYGNDGSADLRLTLKEIRGSQAVLNVEPLGKKTDETPQAAPEVTETPIPDAGQMAPSEEKPSIIPESVRNAATAAGRIGLTVLKWVGGIALILIAAALLIAGVRYSVSFTSKISEVEQYLKQARESGMTDEQIKQALISAGWEEAIVAELLKGQKHISETAPEEKIDKASAEKETSYETPNQKPLESGSDKNAPWTEQKINR